MCSPFCLEGDALEFPLKSDLCTEEDLMRSVRRRFGPLADHVRAAWNFGDPSAGMERF
jgi:hypothetical protein